MRRWAGELFLGLGALHTFVGILLGTDVLPVPGVDTAWHGRGALVGFVELGMVGAAMPEHVAEFGLFWFFMAGFVLMILGATLRWLYANHRIVAPSFVFWLLAGLAALGIVMLPLSGFPLLLLVSVGLLVDRIPGHRRSSLAESEG
jgi:hypothetical protein